MKKKKALIWSLIGFIILVLIGVGLFFFLNRDTHKYDDEEESVKQEEKQEVKDDSATPLLYKVTKDDSNTVIYLFGSIHMADDRAYPLREEIMFAYYSSTYLAVEFDTIAYQKDMSKMVNDAKGMMYLDGTKLKDHLDEDSYNKIVNYLKENNSYSSLYEMYKPVMFYSLVNVTIGNKSGLDEKKGIDNYFLEDAHEHNKNILEVESSDYQFGLFTKYSDKLFEILTLYMIENEEDGVQELKDLYEGWLKGDPTEIISETGEEVPEEVIKKYGDSIKELKKFNKELVDERNENMIKVVDGYFKENKDTFVVVGAAHIVGDKGIAKGLEKLGYKVEIVQYKNS